MISEEMQRKTKEYQDWFLKNGYNETFFDIYMQYIRTAYQVEKDRNFAINTSAFGKKVLEKHIFDATKGGNVWQLHEYMRQKGQQYFALDQYFEILLIEAQNKIFDSYMLYLEKDREVRERFYLPKRKQFLKIGLVQGYQDTLEDVLDILTVSLPPGTGKAQPLYSKVLTPNGFVSMGDLSVGDKVIAGNGNEASVIGVYPQGKKSVYEMTLDNGSKCRCSDGHLWRAFKRSEHNLFSCVTLEFSKIREQKDKYSIPTFTKDNKRVGKVFNKIKNIEYIGEEECQCIMIDEPCHLYITDDYIITHNTTIEKFFVSAVAGWFPKDFSLFFSHSGDITRMFYDGSLDICTNNDEYKWHDIFPDLQITSTNAKMGQFNIGNYKPFPSVQTASVGSENAGKVRASKYLLVDDMIGKLEEALNKNILDKLWGVYSVDARQRKIQDTDGSPCKEIHTCTRWSVHDVVGRLQRMYEGNKRVRCIAVPDIDPDTGESNFDYEYGGFSVAFFKDQELLMDDVSYRCLYKNDPVEREGLLYPADSLRRYLELPDREPDAIWGICDTKGKGTDFLFMPCLYQYDEDYYLVACVCSDDADYEIQYSRMINLITENNMQQCEFESNRDGDRVAYEVSKRLKELGARCNITTHYTMQNKETKIIVNADWVKKHILFRDKSMYTAKEDYGVMMNLLTSHSVAGKNKTDDVPDGLASFALYVTNKRPRTAVIMSSPF